MDKTQHPGRKGAKPRKTVSPAASASATVASGGIATPAAPPLLAALGVLGGVYLLARYADPSAPTATASNAWVAPSLAVLGMSGVVAMAYFYAGHTPKTAGA